MTKTELMIEIDLMEKKLEDSLPARGQRGPMESVLRVIVPIQKDQLRVMRMVVSALPD